MKLAGDEDTKHWLGCSEHMELCEHGLSSFPAYRANRAELSTSIPPTPHPQSTAEAARNRGDGSTMAASHCPPSASAQNTAAVPWVPAESTIPAHCSSMPHRGAAQLHQMGPTSRSPVTNVLLLSSQQHVECCSVYIPFCWRMSASPFLWRQPNSWANPDVWLWDSDAEH